MKKNVEVIEIIWKGPYNVEQIIKNEISDEIFNKGTGVYQIYGTHPIIGANTLLYFGKVYKETFVNRIKCHYKDWIKYELSETFIYFGIINADQETDEELTNKIDMAEKLLVYYSAPPYNSYLILGNHMENISQHGDYIVLNLMRKNMLPYEVSTLWFSSKEWK